MRMRKKAYRDQILNERIDLLIKNPELYQGQWRELLSCKKLHVEIGSGKGDYWRTMAKMDANIGWVGIEQNLNIAAIALKNTVEHSMNNGRFIAENAQNIALWFATNEIDAIHLNFSDPWPKIAHQKRRLTHYNFLVIYQQLLAKHGRIILKTDNKDLMDFSLISLADFGFTLIEYQEDFRKDEHKEEAISEYERRFMEMGIATHHAIWQVNK